MLDRARSGDPPNMLMHATCVLVDGKGVLLVGPSGSGKSDLALRLMDEAARPGLRAQLVADDQVRLRREGNTLVASAPAALAGLIELRGLGIVPVEHAPSARVALVAELKPAQEIERMPEPEKRSVDILGVTLSRIDIDPQMASATARLRAAVVYCTCEREPTE